MSDVLFDAALGGLTLKQIANGAYQSGVTVQPRYASGGVAPSEIHGREADPRFVFTSFDVAGIVGGVSPSFGLGITSGITVPFQKAANGSTYAGSSAHFASACDKGLLICDSISAEQQGNGASGQLTVHCLSDDGSDPVSHSTGNSLSSAAFNAEFDLGPAFITPSGGSATELDIAGITVNTGIEVQKRMLGGYKFPARAFIRRAAPYIDFRFFDFDTVAALLTNYKAVSAVSAYLMKKADGSTHVAGASTVHIKFSFAAGTAGLEGFEAAEANDGLATLRVYGKALTWSATNALP